MKCLALLLFFLPQVVLADDIAGREGFPSEWWTEVPRDQAASWEILPQDAGPGQVILSKRTELGQFSNFTETPFAIDGRTYRSVEGFWQAMKFPESAIDPRATFAGVIWSHQRPEVAQMIGFEAKAAGDQGTSNMRLMGMNWVTYNGVQMDYRVPIKGPHYDLIVRAMRQKLEANPALKTLLLRTGDLVLCPDHDQGDAPPAWKYYAIYMELRAELMVGRFHP